MCDTCIVCGYRVQHKKGVMRKESKPCVTVVQFMRIEQSVISYYDAELCFIDMKAKNLIFEQLFNTGYRLAII